MDTYGDLSTSPDMCERAECNPSLVSTASDEEKRLSRVHSLGSVKAPANFQQRYLDCGLWPDPQALRRQVRELQAENRELAKRLGQPCEKCLYEREQHAHTRAALAEALKLSRRLLEEVRRLSTS